MPANYYPLIADAIRALDPGAGGHDRRTVYERALTILFQQRRSQPSRSESEITAERLALEQTIRKVEAGAAEQVQATGRLRKILDEIQFVSKAGPCESSPGPPSSKVEPPADDGGAK